MNQVQVPIGNLPINLVFLSNATIAFVRVAEFEVLFDQVGTPSGVDAVFYESDFTIGSSDFRYNTAYGYKDLPEMLLWLQQQKLLEPVIHQFR